MIDLRGDWVLEKDKYFTLLRSKLPSYGAKKLSVPGYYKEQKIDGGNLMIYCRVIYDANNDKNIIAPMVECYALRREGNHWERIKNDMTLPYLSFSDKFSIQQDVTAEEMFDWVDKRWKWANQRFDKLVATAKNYKG